MSLCGRCGFGNHSWDHFLKCYADANKPEYVLCVVPDCGVWTRKPTSDGMCRPHLWDNKHIAYARALREKIA